MFKHLVPPHPYCYDMANCLAVAGGDIFKAKEVYENWDIVEAAKWLAVKNGLEYYDDGNDELEQGDKNGYDDG